MFAQKHRMPLILLILLGFCFLYGCNNVPKGPYCGNGILDGNEECDGGQFGPYTCEYFGFSGGRLACSDNCTIDYSFCDGYSELCGNGILDDGEQCDGTNLNNKTCEDIGYDGGKLGCNPACVYDTSQCSGCPNPCLEEGAKKCSDDGASLEVCRRDGLCLHWVSYRCLGWCDEDNLECHKCDSWCLVGSKKCSDDGVNILECQRETKCPSWKVIDSCAPEGDCVSDPTPICITECQDECSPNSFESSCIQGNKVWRNCTMGNDGCFHIKDTLCAQNQWCFEPQFGCETLGSGETCLDAILVKNLPFTLNGTDFNSDFSNDSSWLYSNDGCSDFVPMLGSDLFLKTWLHENQEVVFWERDSYSFSSYTLGVLESCDATSECLATVKDNVVSKLYFTPTHDGTYYFIISKNYQSSSDYYITLDNVKVRNEGSSCDPDDPTLLCEPNTRCVKDSSSVTGWSCKLQETVCDDGTDNDFDGAIDCEDYDCAKSGICGNAFGYWERFNPNNPQDLEGWCITFIHNKPNSFEYSLDRNLSGYVITPGSGAQTQSFTCTTNFKHFFQLPFGINYFNQTFSTVLVSINGWIALEDLITPIQYVPSDTEIFQNNLIMPFWSSFKNGANCTLTQDSSSINGENYWSFSWQNLLSQNGSDTASFQVVLWQRGDITICTEHNSLNRGVSGLSHAGDLPIPQQINLAPSPEQNRCQNFIDDDFDGAIDCDDTDCSQSLDCTNIKAIYQNFDDEQVDVDFHTLTFVPNGSGGYDLTVSNGATPLITPGSGVQTHNINSYPVLESLGFLFPYFNSNFYESVVITDYGYVTFDASGLDYLFYTKEDFLTHPIISSIMKPLQISSGIIDTGIYNSSKKYFSITIRGYSFNNQDYEIYYQLVLFEDGTIVLSYMDNTFLHGIIGVSSGGKLSTAPNEVDLLIPEEGNATTCLNGIDDDHDGDIDCDDSLCEYFCRLWPWELFEGLSDLQSYEILFYPVTQSSGYSYQLFNNINFFINPIQGADEDLLVSDEAVFTRPLPFSFTYDGTSYDMVTISTNGFIAFGENNLSPMPWSTPSILFQHELIAVLWTDLINKSDTKLFVHTGINGDGRQWWAVTWYHWYESMMTNNFIDAQLVLFDDGEIRMYFPTIQFQSVDHITGLGYDNNGYFTPAIDFVL